MAAAMGNLRLVAISTLSANDLSLQAGGQRGDGGGGRLKQYYVDDRSSYRRNDVFGGFNGNGFSGFWRQRGSGSGSDQ
jgi:hypothetical protein